MYISLNINQALEWTIILVSVCILIDTFEKICSIREYSNGGFFNWNWLRQFPGYTERRKVIRRFFDAVFGFRVWFVLLGLRGVAALGLLFLYGQNAFTPVALLVMFIVGSLANLRRLPVWPEIPNRFTLIIIGALFLQSLVPSHVVTVACLWFIAIQSSLSYVTAGVSKLFNRNWLRGKGVLTAVNSTFFATRSGLAELFAQRPLIGSVLTYTTLAFECLFPIVLVVGKPYFFVFLIWGVLFHAVNAWYLRLNNYFWPWVATYPAILYIAQQ